RRGTGDHAPARFHVLSEIWTAPRLLPHQRLRAARGAPGPRQERRGGAPVGAGALGGRRSVLDFTGRREAAGREVQALRDRRRPAPEGIGAYARGARGSPRVRIRRPGVLAPLRGAATAHSPLSTGSLAGRVVAVDW